MVEENVKLTRRWFEEVWNQKNDQTVRELVAPTCIWHGTSETGEELRGPEGFLTLHARLIKVFPDMRIEIGDIFGAGDRVAVRWTATMKHVGEGLGMKPSGADIKIHGMGMARFANGQVAESWDNWDKLGMMQQIEAAAARKSAAGD
jgi:predicted ester cyclase